MLGRPAHPSEMRRGYCKGCRAFPEMRLNFKSPRGLGAVVTRNISDNTCRKVGEWMRNFDLLVGRSFYLETNYPGWSLPITLRGACRLGEINLNRGRLTEALAEGVRIVDVQIGRILEPLNSELLDLAREL